MPAKSFEINTHKKHAFKCIKLTYSLQITFFSQQLTGFVQILLNENTFFISSEVVINIPHGEVWWPLSGWVSHQRSSKGAGWDYLNTHKPVKEDQFFSGGALQWCLSSLCQWSWGMPFNKLMVRVIGISVYTQLTMW